MLSGILEADISYRHVYRYPTMYLYVGLWCKYDISYLTTSFISSDDIYE